MSTRIYGRKPAKRKPTTPPEPDNDNGVKRRRTDDVSAPRPAKDLSAIFDAVVPLATSPVTPIVKRMLGRSRTESSVASSSTSPSNGHSILGRTPSLPSFPSLSMSANAVAVESTPPRKKLNNTRTYAGKSRSFLVQIPVGPETDSMSLGEQLEREEDAYHNQESYTSLRARWGVDNSEDDPYPSVVSPTHSNSVKSTPRSSPAKGKSKAPAIIASLPNGMMNPLKSITELRNRGESRRFLDEVGYLLEGLEKEGGVGLRRATALEIAVNLCNDEFLRKAKAADFIVQALNLLSQSIGDDKILDIIVVLFAALVARDATSVIDFPPDFIDSIFKLLSTFSLNDPLVTLTYQTRADKSILKSIHSTIHNKAHILSSEASLTTVLLITHVLSTAPSSSLSPSNLPYLLNALPGFFKSTPVNHDLIVNCVKLLDSYLLGQWANDNTDLHNILYSALDDWLLDSLVSTGFQNGVVSYSYTEMMLRVLVSLTNTEPKWCEKLTDHELLIPLIMREIANAIDSPEPIKKEDGDDSSVDEESEAKALDKLCLALGLLTNLVQVVERAKNVLMNSSVSPSTNAIDLLVELYKHQLPLKPDPETESADDSFLLGHLAVLFGMLMYDNEDIQSIILNSLPGPNNGIRLKKLIEQATELEEFYNVITGREAKDNDTTKEVILSMVELHDRIR